MLSLLEDAEALLLKVNRKAALDKLTTLRSRIDGCGTVCDRLFASPHRPQGSRPGPASTRFG